MGGEIQLADPLEELLKIEGLNALETDAGIFDCSKKQEFLGANVAVGMRNPSTKRYLKLLFND